MAPMAPAPLFLGCSSSSSGCSVCRTRELRHEDLPIDGIFIAPTKRGRWAQRDTITALWNLRLVTMANSVAAMGTRLGRRSALKGCRGGTRFLE
jgi:hypothetical protein